MTVESRFIQILQSDESPFLQAARIAYGYIEQDDEKKPTTLPICVVARESSDFLTNICGTELVACFVNVSVTHIARTLEECRNQAQAARFALVLSTEQPALEVERDDYDPDLRAWVAVQSYRVFDDNPNL